MGRKTEEKKQSLNEGQRLAIRDIKNAWAQTFGLLKEMVKEEKLIPLITDVAELMKMDLEVFIKKNG